MDAYTSSRTNARTQNVRVNREDDIHWFNATESGARRIPLEKMYTNNKVSFYFGAIWIGIGGRHDEFN